MIRLQKKYQLLHENTQSLKSEVIEICDKNSVLMWTLKRYSKGRKTAWLAVFGDLNRVQTSELAISINLQNEGIVQIRGVSIIGKEAMSNNISVKVAALNVFIETQLKYHIARELCIA